MKFKVRFSVDRYLIIHRRRVVGECGTNLPDEMRQILIANGTIKKYQGVKFYWD